MPSGDLIGTLLVGLVSGGGLATILNFIQGRNKTNAEALHLKAQGEGVGVTAQAQVIDDLQSQNTFLVDRLERLQRQVDGLMHAERTNSLFILNLTLWTHRAYDVMTEEQRKRVGPPPVDTEHDVGGES